LFARQSSSALVSLDNHIAEGEKWWMAGVVLHHPQHHLISSDLLSPIFLRFSPKWREKKIQRIVRLLFYFRSDQFTQSAFAIDIYKTDNGQQISLILPPLFFLILHKHLVRFLVFSFGCLLYVLNAPDFGASITKVLEDLIPATLDSYL
jgi:hypothetical protein